MSKLLNVAGAVLAIGLAGCGGASTDTGDGATVNAEPDTSQDWTEVVSQTDAGGFRMGKPDAPIQIIEFGSLTCSHCAEFSEAGFDPLVENYISQGLVSYEMRNFVRDPLDLTAALLSRCNGAQPYFGITERLFGYQNQMFDAVQNADQSQLQQLQTQEAIQSGAAFVGFAQAAGLIDFVGGMGISGDAARQCLSDAAGRQQLEDMRDQAIAEYDVTWTPTFVINGQKEPGDVTTWTRIEQRLQGMLQ